MSLPLCPKSSRAGSAENGLISEAIACSNIFARELPKYGDIQKLFDVGTRHYSRPDACNKKMKLWFVGMLK